MSATEFFQGYQHDTVVVLYRLRLESRTFLIQGPHTEKWSWGPSHLSMVILKYGQGEGEKKKETGIFPFTVGVREAFPSIPETTTIKTKANKSTQASETSMLSKFYTN